MFSLTEYQHLRKSIYPPFLPEKNVNREFNLPIHYPEHRLLDSEL